MTRQQNQLMIIWQINVLLCTIDVDGLSSISNKLALLFLENNEFDIPKKVFTQTSFLMSREQYYFI